MTGLLVANEVERDPMRGILTRNAGMRQMLARARVAAQTDGTILIFGETGTGKELLARAIHEASPRAGKRFVAIHCEALPEPLLEGELFGWERGAFTGAAQRRIGKFEWADGGTVFLDEIGTLSAATQVSLLRVLEEKALERLGGNETIRIDVRIIAATNVDLEEEVRHGRFRRDLYYRMKVITLRLPPLRERRDDIPLLAVHFAERAAREAHRPVPRISPDAMRVLMEYPWPGNVRELAHTIERAVLLCGGEEIARADLDLGVPLGTVPAQPDLDEGWIAYRRRLIRAGAREFFAQLLAQTRGNVREAARRAGISARAVYDLLAEAELDPDAFRATGNGANGAPDSGPEPFLGSVPPAEGTSTPSSG